jgi:hypothetical protein
MATGPTSVETLTTDDAISLLEELLPAQTHSYLLGLRLGLQVHVVDGIFAAHLHPRDRLLHILIAFLNQEEPRPTWGTVVQALRSPAVSLFQLANKLEATHISDPTATTHNPPTTTTETTAGMRGPTMTSSTGNGSSLKVATMQLAPSRPESPIPDPLTSQYVQAKIKAFERRFNSIKRASRSNLEKRNVSVKQVADALMDLPVDDMEEHKQFLESHLSVLYQAHDQSELFGALSFNMNYLSYQLLEYLVCEFGLEVKEEMERYKSDLRRFRESTPLLLFCRTQRKRYVEPPSRFVEVVAKFEWPKDVTLEVVEQFRQEYACHYNLRECSMMLAEIRPGSFVIAWFVPDCIVATLMANLPEGVLEKYATAELLVAGKLVYTTDEPKMEQEVELVGKGMVLDSPVEEISGRALAMHKVLRPTKSDSEDDDVSEELHLTEDDCLFVNKPSHELFCPITTNLLLQPHLTSCCGNHLSQEAASRIKKAAKACPMCNATHWDTMLNKHFRRQINSLNMFCTYKARGCRWQGELLQLEHHVRSCPLAEAPITTELGHYITVYVRT